MATPIAVLPQKLLSPLSDQQRYVRVLILGLCCFALAYAYTTWLKIPNPLNKAVADTSVILMGLSMLLSSLCYFWNFWDSKISYRKHLGLIGFAFGIVHVGLSWSALQRLFVVETWLNQTYWPALTGLLATLIFTIMALISNHLAASWLGGKVWRWILRSGYLAIALVLAHVVLLRVARWVSWWQAGPVTAPALSLIIAGFMVLVMGMRLVLWWALSRKKTHPQAKN